MKLILETHTHMSLKETAFGICEAMSWKQPSELNVLTLGHWKALTVPIWFYNFTMYPWILLNYNTLLTFLQAIQNKILGGRRHKGTLSLSFTDYSLVFMVLTFQDNSRDRAQWHKPRIPASRGLQFESLAASINILRSCLTIIKKFKAHLFQSGHTFLLE